MVLTTISTPQTASPGMEGAVLTVKIVHLTFFFIGSACFSADHLRFNLAKAWVITSTSSSYWIDWGDSSTPLTSGWHWIWRLRKKGTHPSPFLPPEECWRGIPPQREPCSEGHCVSPPKLMLYYLMVLAMYFTCITFMNFIKKPWETGEWRLFFLD